MLLVRLMFNAIVPTCNDPDFHLHMKLFFFVPLYSLNANDAMWMSTIFCAIAMLPLAMWYFLFFYDPDQSNFPLVLKSKLPRAPFAQIVKTKVLLIENMDNYKYEEEEEDTQLEMTHL